MKLREYLPISKTGQKRLVRVMEVSLIGLFFIGLERGSTGIMVNTGVALAATQLPAILERDYDIPMDPGLTLWIVSAVFLHAWGTVGLPGAEESFYRSLWWWDHLTHALSSSVVAAVGYSTIRALDEHSDLISIPPKLMFVFIILFVVAFGVVWEVIEFAIGGIAAVLGGEAVLTQYGLDDTMLDLIFDVVGGILVAVWGTAYLTDVVGSLGRRFNDRLSG
ncbi:MAG: hypothetical protein SVG88_04160 [Halobacteriales archaeon]|nr:hypothetical protein [Halobacteriales archaeon]